jgi:hypothetical protein
MPHIKPASREAKAAYRTGLPPELRGTFDQLTEALANWRYELGRGGRGRGGQGGEGGGRDRLAGHRLVSSRSGDCLPLPSRR